MIRLDTTKKLQVKLAGAITTSQLPVVASYSDGTSAAYTGGTTTTATNNTTAVDFVAVAPASTVRDVDHVNIYNADTVAATVTVQMDDNGTTRVLRKVVLATAESLEYTHGSGWAVMDASGNRKDVTSTTLPSLTVTGSTTLSGALTVATGTVTDTAPAINVTQTWNDGTDVMTALKANITDTASAASSQLLQLQVGAADRFVVTKEGGVLVRSPSANPFIRLNDASAVDAYIEVASGLFRLNSGSSGATILAMMTGNTERARVNAVGYFKASNTGSYNSSTGAKHEFQGDANDSVVEIRNTKATGNVYGPYIYFSGQTPNNTSSSFFNCSDSTTTRAGIYANGGIYNYSANNVNLSDESVKSDIQPMPSFWDEHKKVAWCSFKYKDQTHADRNFGYRAQNIRYVFAEKAPELVDHCWPTVKVKALNEKGEEILDENGACVMVEDQSKAPLLAVYDRDLLAITQAVVSEAQKRIEELERRLAALEAKLK